MGMKLDQAVERLDTRVSITREYHKPLHGTSLNRVRLNVTTNFNESCDSFLSLLSIIYHGAKV